MTKFLEELRDLLHEYDVTLETSNGINFASMVEEVYIETDNINHRVIDGELSKLNGSN